MKKFNFLVCYDIANSKRLVKVARSLEKIAIRIQKSLFFYVDATELDIATLVKNLKDIINEEEDDIRIYKVDVKNSLHLKSAVNLQQPNII